MSRLNKKYLCDLHTHSTFSDGTKTPTEIVIEAKERGLYAVALTDHNTTDGLREFMEAGRQYGVRTVGGIEFSTDYGEHELHIVALFVTEKNFYAVNLRTEQMRARKEQANRETVRRLCEDGYEIDYDKISAAADGVVNRAHIATALMRAGYVSSVKEAFDTLLAKDGKYYTQPKRLDTLETISYISSIGAVSVLAHPLLTLTEEELRELLPKAKKVGLDAIETVYSTYDEATSRIAREIAREYEMLESGGSDFHGDRKPGISLGSGYGALKVPKEFYRSLYKRHASRTKLWRGRFLDAASELVCELILLGVFLGIGLLVLSVLPESVAEFFEYDYEIVGIITVVVIFAVIFLLAFIKRGIDKRAKRRKKGEESSYER